MAKLQGEIDVSTVGVYSIVTVDMYSYDGFMYSINERTFNSINNLISIENNGTYKTPVRFQADFTEDTSYLGILTENQIIQLGTVDEPDVQTVAPSTVLWVDEMTPATKINGHSKQQEFVGNQNRQ